MKRFLLLFSLIFLTACGYTMAIHESQVNRNLQKTFPLEKSYAVAKVELLEPQVKLLGDDVAEVKLKYRLSAPFVKAKEGVIDARAKVIYDPETKTIYLTDLLPMNIGGDAEKKLLSEVLKAVGRIPVYRFEGTKAQLIKSIKVEEGKILVKFGV